MVRSLIPPWLRLFLDLLLKRRHYSLPFRLSRSRIDSADLTALSPSTNCQVLVELRPRLRCPGCIIGRVKREPGWVSSECFSLRRFVLKFPRCLGCPRNGKQVWTYQLMTSEFLIRGRDVTVNSPIHGKAIRQVLRARIPALNAYGNIAWGGVLIDIFSISSMLVRSLVVP